MTDAATVVGAGCAEFVADAVGVSVCGYSSIAFVAESDCGAFAGVGAPACSDFSGFVAAGADVATGVFAAAGSGFFTAGGSGFFALSDSGFFVASVTVIETT